MNFRENTRVPSVLSYALAAFVSFSIVISGCTKKTDPNDNTIYRTLLANVKGFDPVNLNDYYVNVVASNIYDSLYGYHYLKRPLEVVPELAEGMPKISSDGLTYTIQLKKGIKFQDDECFPEGKGRELVANDFIYAWKRLADPANRSEAFWIFDGRIKGLNEWREKKSKGEADYDTPIAGLQAPDKYTLKILLKEPYYQLVYVLAMTPSTPIPHEAIKHYDKEFTNHPVGTGPFKLKQWTRNSQIELVRNENYRDDFYPTEGEEGDKAAGLLKDAGQKVPFADRLVFFEIIEDQPRWLTFMKGNADYETPPKDNYDSAISADKTVTDELKKMQIKLDIVPDPDLTYIAFNMEDDFLRKNKLVRRAMQMAYDEKTSIEKFYNGRAISAQSPIPPTIDGYDPDYKNPYKEGTVEDAKELLKKAGFPGGEGIPELEYAISSGSTARQMGEFFKQEMNKIGIKINLRAYSWPQLTERIRNRKNQIWGLAWLADYPDAENFLQLIYGPNSSPGPNGANFSHAKYNELYEKAVQLPPGKERTAIYHKMRDIAVEEHPWIINVHRLGFFLSHSWLKNFKPNRVIDGAMKYYRVDPKARAEQKAKF